MNKQYEAAEALAAIGEARVRLVSASETPPSRHLAFAALLGGLVVAPVLPIMLRFVAIALILVSIALIIRWDRRRTGMFINGYRAGATRRVTFAMLAMWLVLYTASNWLALGLHLVWPSLVLAVVAVGIGYASSVWWCRVFAREMGAA